MKTVSVVSNDNISIFICLKNLDLEEQKTSKKELTHIYVCNTDFSLAAPASHIAEKTDICSKVIIRQKIGDLA